MGQDNANFLIVRRNATQKTAANGIGESKHVRKLGCEGAAGVKTTRSLPAVTLGSDFIDR